MPPLEPGAGTVLVTGAAGFVGSWLLRELAAAGHPLIATHRPGEGAPRSELPGLHWIPLDVRDGTAVSEALAALRPDAVVHLAAVAVPRQAAADPLTALETNYLAVDHLLRALELQAARTRLLLVSSGEVYGARETGATLASEGDPLAPTNLYAATKAAAEQRAVLSAAREGLDVVRARPFNHTGPGRPASYAESSFARQIATAERDPQQRTVRVGNLAAIRDWNDVRDVVHAYRLLLERGRAGEVYNVCSGQGRSVAEVLDGLRELARVPVEVTVDPARFETIPPERLALVGNPAKLSSLGWTPRHSFRSTLACVLDDWRARA